jgi:DNA repair protein RecN (Recombination protein N)
MLRQINLRNFTIVDELELEIGPGMTALTGETGAGKSILVDAMGLILGDRADSGVVRHGTEKAEITISFDLLNLPEASLWLQEQEMSDGDDCIIRRIISRDGRSRAFINGTPTTIRQLQELGNHLVEIHGQHEHQNLLRRDRQRGLLDSYGELDEQLNKLAQTYTKWSGLQHQFEDISLSSKDRQDRVDLLRFQAEELRTAAIETDEWTKASEEHGRLAHAGLLKEASEGASNALYESDEQSIYSQLQQHLTTVEEASRIDTDLKQGLELLQQASINIQEAHSELRHYADRIDLDPSRLNWLEQRLGLMKELSRKHQCTPEELPAIQEAIEAELEGLTSGAFDLEQLEQALADAADDYRQLSLKLNKARVKAAKKLGKGITEAMQGLGMEGGSFDIEVHLQEAERFTAQGMDQIEFMVSANPGQPLKPLTKVASGGELARISLAIQMLAASSLEVPTLVFDEVDSGIGGAVAEIVGRLLRSLGRDRQVLCVTHLPQVAAQAHHHAMVEKSRSGEETRTSITVLERQQRTEELARMLGGVDLTDQTIAHAEEMLERAASNTS